MLGNYQEKAMKVGPCLGAGGPCGFRRRGVSAQHKLRASLFLKCSHRYLCPPFATLSRCPPIESFIIHHAGVPHLVGASHVYICVNFLTFLPLYCTNQEYHISSAQVMFLQCACGSLLTFLLSVANGAREKVSREARRPHGGGATSPCNGHNGISRRALPRPLWIAPESAP